MFRSILASSSACLPEDSTQKNVARWGQHGNITVIHISLTVRLGNGNSKCHEKQQNALANQ